MLKSYEIIKSPWLSQFVELIKAAKDSFTFTSPFIKLFAVNKFLENRMNNFSVRGITSFRLRNFERKASDIEAIKKLFYCENSIIKNVPNIHSKIYIFDSFAAIISSSNLTTGGLLNNVEMGILIREKSLIEELNSHIEKLIFDEKSAFDITEEIIIETENILHSIPEFFQKREKELSDFEKELFRKEETVEDKIFQSGTSSILNGLSGWKRDVFKCLTEIEKEIFTLDDIYQYEKKLYFSHPENRYIKPKIRQQLQILRDIGLLEFTSKKGVYRKLWK